MALSIDEANTVSTKYFDKTLTQQVYEKSPLFAKLKSAKKVTTDGGNKIQFGIRYTTLGRAETVDAREQITYTQKETRTAGDLDWKYYIGQSMLQWDERVKNTGKPQIINLMADKTEEMRQDMFNKFQTDLYNTTQASKSFSGLDEIVDSADTYAGITVSDVAEWAATEDSSTTKLVLYGTSGSFAHQMNEATFGPDKPDLVITTRDLFNKFESLVEPQIRYESGAMGKLGFTALQYHGADVVADYACTDEYMYGLCTKYFEFRVHPDFNFKPSKWEELLQAGFPHALVKIVSWAGNLCCKMRKVNFKYSALDYTA